MSSESNRNLSSSTPTAPESKGSYQHVATALSSIPKDKEQTPEEKSRFRKWGLFYAQLIKDRSWILNILCFNVSPKDFTAFCNEKGWGSYCMLTQDFNENLIFYHFKAGTDEVTQIVIENYSELFARLKKHLSAFFVGKIKRHSSDLMDIDVVFDHKFSIRKNQLVNDLLCRNQVINDLPAHTFSDSSLVGNLLLDKEKIYEYGPYPFQQCCQYVMSNSSQFSLGEQMKQYHGRIYCATYSNRNQGFVLSLAYQDEWGRMVYSDHKAGDLQQLISFLKEIPLAIYVTSPTEYDPVHKLIFNPQEAIELETALQDIIPKNARSIMWEYVTGKARPPDFETRKNMPEDIAVALPCRKLPETPTDSAGMRPYP